MTNVPIPRSPSRSEFLDGLRGMAIIGVVAVHSMQISSLIRGDKETSFSTFVNFGKYGVELFFWLSGWLLVSIYGFRGNLLGRAYGYRRIARIYPLWIAFLIIAIFRSTLTSSGGFYVAMHERNELQQNLHNAWGMIFLTMTFLLFTSASLWNTVIPGGWSIQAEVAHYLFFPLVRNKPLTILLSGALVLNLMTLVLILFRSITINLPELVLQIISSWLRLGFYSSCGFFIIGIVSCVLYQNILQPKDAIESSDEIEIPKILFALFLLSLTAVPCPVGSNLEALIYVSVTIAFTIVLKKVRIVYSLIKFLGRYSYFIYFMHFLILAAIRWLTLEIGPRNYSLIPMVFFFLSVLGVTFVTSSCAAVVSMKYFEKPVIKFAHKFH